MSSAEEITDGSDLLNCILTSRHLDYYWYSCIPVSQNPAPLPQIRFTPQSLAPLTPAAGGAAQPMGIPAASLAARSAVGAALAAVIAARAVRRRSLDGSGGAAGFVVMAIHLACGYRYGALMLAFFFTSSKATKIGADRKRRIEDDFKEGGQRNW